MREVRGPDSLFVIEVDMDAEESGEVIRALNRAYPESVALTNVTDNHLTVFSKERALIADVDELRRDGKIKQYTVK